MHSLALSSLKSTSNHQTHITYIGAIFFSIFTSRSPQNTYHNASNIVVMGTLTLASIKSFNPPIPKTQIDAKIFPILCKLMPNYSQSRTRKMRITMRPRLLHVLSNLASLKSNHFLFCQSPKTQVVGLMSFLNSCQFPPLRPIKSTSQISQIFNPPKIKP